MNKFIRDKDIFILFVFGFGLTFFIVFNGIHLLNAWYHQMVRSETETGYANQVSFSVITPWRNENDEWSGTVEEWEKNRKIYKVQTEKLLQLLESEKGNVYINDINLPVGSELIYQSVKIIMDYNESWYRSLKQGRYPIEEDFVIGKNVAIIGESLCEYIEEINGVDYISICGSYYEVLGIFENYHAADYDMGVCIFYDCVDDRVKEYILEEMVDYLDARFDFFIICGSDFLEMSNVADVIIQTIQNQLYFKTEFVEQTDDNETGNYYTTVKAIFLGLVFLFSIFNCSQITRLWIIRKRKELVICKAFGMNNKQILARLIKELMIMIGIAILLDVVLQTAYWMIWGMGKVTLNDSIRSILYMGIALIVTVALVMEPHVRLIKKIDPAQGLRDL